MSSDDSERAPCGPRPISLMKRAQEKVSVESGAFMGRAVESADVAPRGVGCACRSADVVGDEGSIARAGRRGPTPPGMKGPQPFGRRPGRKHRKLRNALKYRCEHAP
ncbi:hypothetical protein PSP6_250082 [Paraburkholderia tropica]|nr:hypothetical protein PSP6_250082 [Paraburkholderia tropica]